MVDDRNEGEGVERVDANNRPATKQLDVLVPA